MQGCATQLHMKNITLTIDDETHRIARVRAAELGTSVSAMVKDYLNGLEDASEPEPQFKGVREMPMPYFAQSAALSDKIGIADDLGEWPPEMQSFFKKLQSDPLDDAFDALP
jgi:plasmid stability protein